MNDRSKIVKRFWEECVWAKSIRSHSLSLYESGDERKELLSEVANTFFSDLNVVLQEYVILQICKLTDPAQTGKPSSGKDNLTTNYIIGLDWPSDVQSRLNVENKKMMVFRSCVNDVRRKAIAHADLKVYTNSVNLGSFGEREEVKFWEALDTFVNIAYFEVFGELCEIDLPMPDGNAQNLIYCLIDGIDYGDILREKPSFISERLDKVRYRNA